MVDYILAGIGLFAVFLFIKQNGTLTLLRIQKDYFSGASAYLGKSLYLRVLEFLTFLSLFVVLLAHYFLPLISFLGVCIAILSLWAMAQHYSTWVNPYTLLDKVSKKAYQAIEEKNLSLICDGIEHLQEFADKGIDHESLSLVSAALDKELEVGKKFLSESNTLDLPQIGYVIQFLFERLKGLSVKGLNEKRETICVKINTILGKLALHALKTHPHFTASALALSGKLAEESVRAGYRDVGIKTGLMLIELSRSIAEEGDVEEKELQEALLEIVKNLEEISKELYKQNKNTPLEIIKEPLLQLKLVLVGSKNNNHPAVALAIADIDRVLSEYQELELILRTIPPITS